MKKMGFIDHDLWKFHALDMSRYMAYVWEIADEPIHLVPMEWVRRVGNLEHIIFELAKQIQKVKEHVEWEA